MKPRLLLARLYDLYHYSWKAARANRFLKILFIKKQTQWSNDKTIISQLKNYFDAAFSPRIIVVPVETLLNEFNWYAKDLLLGWNFMFHEFTFFFLL